MADLVPIASGSYRLIAERLAASPIMLKAVLESWCNLNCTGTWNAKIGSTSIPVDARAPTVELDFHTDDDLVLFMLSAEYGYMGRPPLKPLTN